MKSMRRYATVTWMLMVPAILLGQNAPPAQPSATPKAPAAAAPKAAPAKAAPKPATPVDKVIGMAKAGLGEDLIVKAIVKDNLKADLGADEMVRLKQAGVTDKVISAMMDPSSAGSSPAPSPAPVAAAAPTPAPAPVAIIPAAVSVPAPAPVTSSAAPAAAPADPKAGQRTAAVDEFDWGTVKTAVQEVFKTNVDIGKGIRALLTTRVQAAGKIRIVERAKVQTVMKEQDFDASNRVKKGTGSRIGQIRGADVYVMGDIVAFGRDDRDKRVGLGGFGVRGPLGAIKLGSKEDKAVVIIDYRLVDAETSEVIDTGEARGESKRTSKGLAGVFGNSGGIVGGGVDMTASNFAQTIIGEATMDACDKLAAIMNSKIPGLPKHQVDVEALVADVSGSSVTLAAGANDGIAVGDRFEVLHIVSEIKDPVSGEVLDKKVEKSGELTITSVRDRIATGTYSGGPVAPKTYVARKILQ
jgi:curli biogenesis system outer membrane secretion channel CsgG